MDHVVVFGERHLRSSSSSSYGLSGLSVVGDFGTIGGVS
jgi:hypothetical protein